MSYLTVIDHTEYSNYTHSEVIDEVVPFVTSNVELIPLEVLDTQDVSLSKFRIGVGSCFYQEMAACIDSYIKLVNNVSKLYYYAGDRLPTLSESEYGYQVMVCNVYMKAA